MEGVPGKEGQNWCVVMGVGMKSTVGKMGFGHGDRSSKNRSMATVMGSIHNLFRHMQVLDNGQGLELKLVDKKNSGK